MYLDLIINSFLANFCFPLRAETIYYAMLAWDRYPLIYAISGGMIGAMLAATVHLFIGMVLAHANMQKEEPGFLRTGKFLNKYGVWLLALPGLRIAGFLTILMVAAGVKPRKAAWMLMFAIVAGYVITGFITKNSTLFIGLVPSS